MILFVNFAPVTFGGGAERWILSVAKSVSINEDVQVIQADRKISDLYAQLVMKRKFDTRITINEKHILQQYITWLSLVPFSKSHEEIRSTLLKARLLYTKLEVNELFLIIYFGGFSMLKKLIIGLHSPFIYVHRPLSFFELLHNVVYKSFISRIVLSLAHKVHVLNEDQESFLKNKFNLTNVVRISNYLEKDVVVRKSSNNDILKIAFVGELSVRKGADVLIQVINKSPEHFIFHIAGDGPLANDYKILKLNNVRYHGQIEQIEVDDLLSRADVLIMPSVSESFSLSMLGALSHGLKVVCNRNVSFKNIESYLCINKTGSVEEYIRLLEDTYLQKMNGDLNKLRSKVSNEINANYSKRLVVRELKSKLFGLKKKV